MKRRHLILAIVFTVLCIPGCSKNSSPSGAAGPGNETELGIINAKLFTISYKADGVKLIRDGDDRTLLLVPRDLPVPSGYEGLPLVRTPVQRAYFLATTQVGMLDALGDEALFDTIAALSSDEADWTMPEIARRFQSGQIRHIPQYPNGIDVEKLIAADIDVVFISAKEVGAKSIPLIEDAGISYCTTASYLEDSNFGGLEWIKFFAAFYNLDREADIIYRRKLERLEELGRLCADIPPAERPLAAYGNGYKGVVYTQGGESVTSRELERAGARYFLRDLQNTGTIRLSMEEFYERAKDADVLIYTSMIQFTPDKRALLEEYPVFEEFKSLKNDRVYVLSKGYYINSAALDTKFEDTVSILYPKRFPDRELTFYVKLPD
jgi:iron complex transport system substrate-binding protein